MTTEPGVRDTVPGAAAMVTATSTITVPLAAGEAAEEEAVGEASARGRG